ncbi:MAG TPA: exopolyphosphatase [Bacteroidia bacterium]|nr:exopolyphosphatase [Bacteroidia bacterium]
MKHAILDLGTNTFHLLIVEAEKDFSYRILHQSRRVVKLGEGTIEQNLIDTIPFQRGLGAIVSFCGIIREHGAERIHAYATSAVRSAVNGRDFVEMVHDKTGIPIDVIDGEQEAELIYYGIRQCVQLDERPVLMMDIGGGSVEFILGSGHEIYWKKSYPVGVARLLEKFSPSDPISERQVRNIENYLQEQLDGLPDRLNTHPVESIIGSSGSFESYAEIIRQMQGLKPGKRKSCSFEFDLEEYYQLHHHLLRSTREERKKMKGLLKMRVDMIVLASIVTHYVLRIHPFSSMKLSGYALKEGALWKSLRS